MSTRLATGGRVDRGRPISFAFDGKKMTGFVGDTLASALLANGVTLIGRSFKYHRPRGIYSAGAEEPNALVTLGTGAHREPNVPATMVELCDGLVAESQNRWPSLRFDVQSINSLFAPLLAAGFYYKTFMGPTRRAWMAYEPFIRRAAGLGRASEAVDPDRYQTRHAFCEVAVVGSGPAGLAAALTATHSGAKVVLIEQDFMLGGALLSHPVVGPEATWLADATVALKARPNLRTMTRTTAFGLYDGGTLGLVEGHDHASQDGGARQRLVLLRCRSIVFATGAIERPLVFANNDRPGVMLASAARTYLHRYGVLPGRRIVVATNNDSAYRAAADLAAAGAKVVLADLRPTVPRHLAALAKAAGVDVKPAASIAHVHGGRRLRAVDLSSSSDGGAGVDRMTCDLVCVSGGWSPTIHLTSHLGRRPIYRDDIAAFVAGELTQGQYSAGAVTGTYATAAAVDEGGKAGAAAAAYCGYRADGHSLKPFPADEGAIAATMNAASPSPARGKAFVDLQNDVTTDDIRLAHREGYASVEHLKRYTTLGMGTDQGKTSNVNALMLMAELRHAPIADIGTTTFRPPYTPVAIGTLAGRNVGGHFRPTRRTPMHDWHIANGAAMIEVGLWMRPWFYRDNGASVDAAYIKEMRNVRDAAGIIDISTLGKIEIEGPDATEFLDRVYANSFANLKVGRARYGVMLRDDGIVFDDGTVTRLDEQHYFMTTSTAKAADVMSWLEFLLDTAWADLRVHVTSVSDEWAAMSVAGPHSRAILAAAFPALDLSDTALPHMGALVATEHGHELRILRLSYSGELAFEVYVAASRGVTVWERIIGGGHGRGPRPYGVEALGALRVEKGHVAGPEIDGRTTLRDLGLDRLASRTKPFVGAALSQRPGLLDPERPSLVGLECIEPGERLRSGAVLFNPDDARAGHGRGRVTSVTYSPSLGRYVGLGLYAGGLRRQGAEVVAVHPIKNEIVRSRVVAPVFLDPAGERLHG